MGIAEGEVLHELSGKVWVRERRKAHSLVSRKKAPSCPRVQLILLLHETEVLSPLDTDVKGKPCEALQIIQGISQLLRPPCCRKKDQVQVAPGARNDGDGKGRLAPRSGHKGGKIRPDSVRVLFHILYRCRQDQLFLCPCHRDVQNTQLLSQAVPADLCRNRALSHSRHRAPRLKADVVRPEPQVAVRDDAPCCVPREGKAGGEP